MNNIFMLLGDSLTFGYGVSKSKSFSYLLNEKLKLPVINKGINGDTTVSMINRLYEDILYNNPKYIFIMGGTNDLLCRRSLSNTIDNLNEIIIECKKVTPNIFIGIPPCIIPEEANKLFSPSEFYDYASSNLPKLRDKLISLCNLHLIKYIDLFSITYNYINNHNNETIYVDGIHLNNYGNKLIFNELLKIIPHNLINP